MTDKEILNEVYKMCCNPFERCDVKSFIEQEWQKEDEHADFKAADLKAEADAKSLGQFSESWYDKKKL